MKTEKILKVWNWAVGELKVKRSRRKTKNKQLFEFYNQKKNKNGLLGKEIFGESALRIHHLHLLHELSTMADLAVFSKGRTRIDLSAAIYSSFFFIFFFFAESNNYSGKSNFG